MEPHDRLASAFRLADEYERLDPRPALEEFLAEHEDLADLIRPLLAPSEESESDDPTEPAGEKIGAFELIEVIGEGAFGVVYRALQRKPLRREVALKILKPGLESREILARFDAERQALALMDHPNIARVIDAGETESGRPYFVMELVRGSPLTELCATMRLGIDARLQLFVNVCRAVEHAHRKGVVHRDLKPMNLLVTTIEGRPVPKVIDFGIAKALDRKLTDKTLFTQARLVIGTPAYMSPEQARQTVSEVDHRSDVYSLGVILYELLTGALPIEFAEDTTGVDLYRQIQEVEPPRPSTRLETNSTNAPGWSAELRTDPRTLRERVRGDLDRVIMKCLEKDRDRRYASAQDLADDIERFLANEPVRASFPSLAYRLRKAYDRQRTTVVAVTIASALLLIGSFSAWIFWSDRSGTEPGLETGRLEAQVRQAESRRLLETARTLGMPEGERWALDEILRRGEAPPDPALVDLLAEIYQRSPSQAMIPQNSAIDVRVLPHGVRIATRRRAWDWNLDTLELRSATAPLLAENEAWGIGRLTRDGEYLVAMSLELLRAFRLRDDRELWSMPLPPQPRVGSPTVELGDGFELGLTDGDGRLWLGRDLRDGPPEQVEDLPPGSRILPFSPAGELTVFEVTNPNSGRVLVRQGEEWHRGEEITCSPGFQVPNAIWLTSEEPTLIGSVCGDEIQALFPDPVSIPQFAPQKAHSRAISAIEVSETWLASAAGDVVIKVWDLSRDANEPRRPAYELPGADRPAGRLRFTSEPLGLLSLHDNGELRWWDLDAKRHERPCFDEAEAGAVIDAYGSSFSMHSVAIDPTGRFVAWGGGVPGRGFLELSTFLEDREIPTELLQRAQPGLIGSVAFSADGNRLAVLDYEGGIWIIASQDGSVLAEGRHSSRLTALRFLEANSNRLLTGSMSGELFVWSESGRGTLESRAFEAHTQRVSGTALSVDGHWIASTCPQGSELFVRRWLPDVSELGEIARRFRMQDVRAPRFLPTDRLVAAADDRLVVIDLTDPVAPVRSFGTGRHQGRIFGLEFSSRNGLLATGGQDGAVLLWKVLPGGEIELLRNLRTAEFGNSCFHLSFSPDGRFLAAALERGTESVVWDLRYYDKHVAGNLAGVLDAQQRAGEGPPPEVARRIKQWIQETWRR